MQTCWFIVIQSRGAWWVDREGRSYGPFLNQREAEQYARKIAETDGDPKRRSEVWAPGLGGGPVLRWKGAEPARVTAGEQERIAARSGPVA
jgi:hypothetical protein